MPPVEKGCPGNEAPSEERLAGELGSLSPATKGHLVKDLFGTTEPRIKEHSLQPHSTRAAAFTQSLHLTRTVFSHTLTQWTPSSLP